MSPSRTVYVGNLPFDIREREVEDLFAKFGRITKILVKTPRAPPAYAFVEFDDERDAEDAVRGRDGYDFDGGRIRVEISRGRRDDARSGGVGARGGGYDDRDHRPMRQDDDRDGGGYRSSKPYDDGGGGRRTQTRKTDYQVLVEDLPGGCDWRDVKDAFRRAGEVTYANVFVNRDGRTCSEVHFSNSSDARYAVDKFDDTEFESNGGKSYIRVRVVHREPRRYYRDDDRRRRDDYGRGRSRSRSRDRGRSHSRSRSRSHSHSRSRSRSPRGGASERRSRSPSRGRSYSDDDDARRGRSPTPRAERARAPDHQDPRADDPARD